MSESAYPFETLPDLLRPGLDIVFVGINPSLMSVDRGHYFARNTNRFWPALSRSRLSARIRSALGRDALGPEDDEQLLDHGFGFTDVVKRPSPNVSTLRPADYLEWSPRLIERLERYAPRIVCFHGVTGYRAVARYALDSPREPTPQGLLPRTLGSTRLYLAPNPSPANAHFTPADQVAAYDGLCDLLRGTPIGL